MRSLAASTTYTVPFATSSAADAKPTATAYADATSLGAMTVTAGSGTNDYTVAVVLPGNVAQGQIITVKIDWDVGGTAQATATLLVGEVGLNAEIASSVKTKVEEAGGTLASLASKLGGITVLANWLRAFGRKGSADATALSEINTGGGSYDPATDSFEAHADKLATVVSGGATFVSPVLADGTIDELIAGDDYTGNTALTWTVSGVPDLTGADIYFGAHYLEHWLAGTGAATDNGDGTWGITVTLSIDQLQVAGKYSWHVRAEWSETNKHTFLGGEVPVKKSAFQSS